MSRNVKVVVGIAAIIIIGIAVLVVEAWKDSTTVLFPITGVSMEPAFHDRDIVKLEKAPDLITNGDVIVHKQNNEYYIKRVIGVGGDTVSFKENRVYLNKKMLEEPYVKCVSKEFLDAAAGEEVCNYRRMEGQSFKIPESTYFVMGDNRNHSSDSRANNMMKERCEAISKIMGECVVPKTYIEKSDILGKYVGEKK